MSRATRIQSAALSLQEALIRRNEAPSLAERENQQADVDAAYDAHEAAMCTSTAVDSDELIDEARVAEHVAAVLRAKRLRIESAARASTRRASDARLSSIARARRAGRDPTE